MIYPNFEKIFTDKMDLTEEIYMIRGITYDGIPLNWHFSSFDFEKDQYADITEANYSNIPTVLYTLKDIWKEYKNTYIKTVSVLKISEKEEKEILSFSF